MKVPLVPPTGGTVHKGGTAHSTLVQLNFQVHRLYVSVEVGIEELVAKRTGAFVSVVLLAA